MKVTKRLSALYPPCFLNDSHLNILESSSVFLHLELPSNQEDAAIVEQPEVIPLTDDDQEEQEGGEGRSPPKLSHHK